MNNLEYIAELDKRIEYVERVWADEVVLVLADPSSPEGSRKYESKIKKLNKKYGQMVVTLLKLRDSAHQREAKKQLDEFEAKFVDAPDMSQKKTDENGRPIGKIWKNGQWQDIKKKSQE